MALDLAVRGGRLVDGTGSPCSGADVGVAGDRIVAVGEVPGEAAVELDAAGMLVTPGFVDLHTHYDGQATWASSLGPSSEHGVTTVVTGNCGVGFAPCRPEDRRRLVQLMEGVEDIPEAVMAAGLPWDWESFPEFLDRLGERRFDIDVAVQLAHAPLRLFAMGGRALTRQPATPDDVVAMRRLAGEALEAGALGFSTSRSLNHKAVDGSLIPSYHAAGDELAGIAGALADTGTGVLQLISDFDDVDAEFAIIRRMAEESGRPVSVTVLQFDHAPDRWRQVLDRIEAAAAEGLAIRGQVCGRPVGLMMGLTFSRHPFMGTDAYREVACLPLPERLAALRTAGRRQAILQQFPGRLPGSAALLTTFTSMFPFEDAASYEAGAGDSVAARAEAAGCEPAAWAYDHLTAGDGTGVLYVPVANYSDRTTEVIEAMLASDATILGLGDGGAHCGLICDASLPTYMLERWSDIGRGTIPVQEVVKWLTADTADAVGLLDRGVVAPGRRADLNVIDAAGLGLAPPEMVHDLPDGGGRIRQAAGGYVATVVAGRVTRRHGAPTGELPGRLVRGPAQPGPARPSR
ncbi:MAG: N-acyl-D-amino-acid deacylase family protein [Acidimicrobiales bacterium]